MEKSTNDKKLAGTVTSAILACLFTGGIAVTIGFSLPVTIVVTIAVVFAIAYGKGNE